MILKNLAIKNFKGIHELEINFNRNLIRISGRNASGKSSIVDAWFWLLFGKNQYGDTKFEIRELDQDGNKVHMTEISVEGVVEHNGKEYILTRTQVENWVKKRGQEDRELSGNKDSFMINGYPKSKTEYEDFIKSIMDEKIFRILSSPNTFPNLDWKEQRKILMSFVDIDPADLKVEGIELILGELEMETPDAIRKKYSDEKKRLNKILDTIPVEIDTLNSQIVQVDTDALAEEERIISGQIDDIQSKIVELGKVNNDLINAQIAECQTQQKILVANANEERNAKIRAAKEAVTEIKTELSDITFQISDIENKIMLKTNTYKSMKEQIEEKLARYKALKADIESAVFPESDTICKYCGQTLPEDQIEERRKNWEKGLKDDRETLDEMQRDGNKIAMRSNVVADEIQKLKASLDKGKDAKAKMSAILEEKAKALEEAVYSPINDGTSSPEYQELSQKIETLRGQLKDMDEIRHQVEVLRAERDTLKSRLSDVHQKQAQAVINKRLETQIAEKHQEQRDVAQKVADAERKLYVLDNYIKAVSERINSQFEGLTFKLFSSQLNGGIGECCEVLYNGVPYSALNSGHKIVVGLEIIKTFQKLYGVTMPTFVDNSETLNDSNLPTMDNQLILLKVTDTDLTFS